MKETISPHSETFTVKLYRCAATFPERKIQEREIRKFLPPRGTSECLLQGELQLHLSPNVVEEAPGVSSLMQPPAFCCKVLRHQS